jgi:hypothetical protein
MQQQQQQPQRKILKLKILKTQQKNLLHEISAKNPDHNPFLDSFVQQKTHGGVKIMQTECIMRSHSSSSL